VLIARYANSEAEQHVLCGLIMLNGQLIRVLDPALSLLPGLIHRKYGRNTTGRPLARAALFLSGLAKLLDM
jgi:hypothetical protein